MLRTINPNGLSANLLLKKLRTQSRSYAKEFVNGNKKTGEFYEQEFLKNNQDFLKLRERKSKGTGKDKNVCSTMHLLLRRTDNYSLMLYLFLFLFIKFITSILLFSLMSMGNFYVLLTSMM